MFHQCHGPNLLQPACLRLTTSGVTESLGPIEYSTALPVFFQSTVGQDDVSGQCLSGHSFFFRVHKGAVIATFTGSFAQNVFSGTVSKPGKAGTSPWSAAFVPCQNHDACNRNCATSHCAGEKPPCSPCYAKCLAACRNGQNDDPNCSD